MPFGASRAGLMSVAADDIPDSVVSHYDATKDDRETGSISSIPDRQEVEDLDDGTQVTLVSDGINGNSSYESNGVDNYLIYDPTETVGPPTTVIGIVEPFASTDDRDMFFDRGGGGLIEENGGWEYFASEDTHMFDSGPNQGELRAELEVGLSNTPNAFVLEILSDSISLEIRTASETFADSVSSASQNGFGDMAVDVFRDERDIRYFEGYTGELAIADSNFDSELDNWLTNNLFPKWGIE